MTWLPGNLLPLLKEDFLTTPEYRFVICWQYLLILIYTVILIIVITNIVQILILQRRWKTLPLLLFYIFAFIATLGRTVYSIILFTTKYAHF